MPPWVDVPTKLFGKKLNQKQDLNSFRCVFSSRIDEKGRIVIPSSVRSTLGLGKGTEVAIELSVLKSEIIFRIDNGCSDVKESTEDCGSSRPGSKGPFLRKGFETPGCVPENKGGVLDGRKV